MLQPVKYLMLEPVMVVMLDPIILHVRTCNSA